jgi:four helix bundle protein
MGEEMGRIIEKSFIFALDIIELYKVLIENSEFVISKQLLRCGTSIGANVNEAQAASSKRDFLNKMSIAAKEVRESDYWLKLLSQSQVVKKDYSKYLTDINEIIKILTAIVISTKNNLIS